jgi:hypothetical protein
MSVVIVSAINKPRNYEDCILKHMKEAQTREAAFAITHACRQQFPNPFDQFDGQKPGGK